MRADHSHMQGWQPDVNKEQGKDKDSLTRHGSPVLS